MVRKYSTEEIKNIIRLEAARQGVPVDLALAVAQQESGFNNLIQSKPNADGSVDRGVMQLNSKYHKLKNWQDPIENISYGIRHLKGLLAGARGDARKALSDYNAGANATGKGRKQGDSYAQKVIALMNKGNNSNMTGAAAPVPNIPSDDSLGDRMSNLVQGNVDLATQGISNYASTPYNPSMALALRAQRQREYEDMLNKLVRETPINPTPEQVATTSQPFNQNVQNMALASADAMNRIQGLTGVERYQPYEERLRQAYENQIARLEAANPYTQMGQMAPVDLEEYARALNRQQQTNAMIRANNIAMGGQAQPVDFGSEALQLAQAQRMANVARQTGLTPEEYITGQTANYNQMATQLAAQNKNLNDLYARAMQGDIQAMQAIQQIATNLNANITSNVANQATAQHQLRQDQLAAEKENRERYFDMLKQIQGLDVPMVQEGGAQQRANTTTAGSMYNTGLTSGTNAAGNLANYEGRMISGQDANVIKPPTPQQVISTYGQVAGMSNDPTAVQNWANAAGQAYSAAGVPDAYLLPFLNNQSQR